MSDSEKMQLQPPTGSQNFYKSEPSPKRTSRRRIIAMLYFGVLAMGAIGIGALLLLGLVSNPIGWLVLGIIAGLCVLGACVIGVNYYLQRHPPAAIQLQSPTEIPQHVIEGSSALASSLQQRPQNNSPPQSLSPQDKIRNHYLKQARKIDENMQDVNAPVDEKYLLIRYMLDSLAQATTPDGLFETSYTVDKTIFAEFLIQHEACLSYINSHPEPKEERDTQKNELLRRRSSMNDALENALGNINKKIAGLKETNPNYILGMRLHTELTGFRNGYLMDGAWDKPGLLNQPQTDHLASRRVVAGKQERIATTQTNLAGKHSVEDDHPKTPARLSVFGTASASITSKVATKSEKGKSKSTEAVPRISRFH